MKKNLPRRYKLTRELIGGIVILSGPLDVFVGFKLAQEDWLWAGLGLAVATSLSWLYWELYMWLLERLTNDSHKQGDNSP